MAEYWKSTPKYWCKHCKTYIRDTKLEKTNHEATPKHQGNLKRFLRDLHRGHERDEKDKERAKSEVARLNGLVAGEGSGSGTSSPFGRGPTPVAPKPQATAAQRKQQLAQLAEMGVSIPDEFRPDMAMAGEWQVTEERVVETDGERKPDAVALGVRKRAIGDEEEEAAEANKRKWGSTYRPHPIADDDEDLDALLGDIKRKHQEPVTKLEGDEDEIPREELPLSHAPSISGTTKALKSSGIKGEPSDEEPIKPPVPLQTEQKGQEVVFKKRKAKNIRQR